jgi:hypothetical protein
MKVRRYGYGSTVPPAVIDNFAVRHGGHLAPAGRFGYIRSSTDYADSTDFEFNLCKSVKSVDHVFAATTFDGDGVLETESGAVVSAVAVRADGLATVQRASGMVGSTPSCAWINHAHKSNPHGHCSRSSGTTENCPV